jgi:hypothetical protein
VVACTVHLWNALFVLFLFLIGSGVWLLEARPDSEQSTTPVPGDGSGAHRPVLVRPDGTPERLF